MRFAPKNVGRIQVYRSKAAPRRRELYTCLVLPLVMLAGCDSGPLSEVPKRIATAPSVATTESTIGLKLGLPFSELQRLANDNAPTTFDKGGRQRPCKNVLGVDVCADVDYHINASRTGAISVSQHSETKARIAVPIKISGWAGFNGFIADITKLNKKNFDGALVAYADVGLSLREDWCPDVAVDVSYQFTSAPRVEIVGGVWIPIEDSVKGDLNKQLATLADGIRSGVKCEQVREGAEKLWAKQAFPLAKVPAGEVAALVEPTFAGFSGVSVDSTSINMALAMKAKTAIITNHSDSDPVKLPLPPLQLIPLEPGTLNLEIPIHAAYETLERAIAAQTQGKTFSTETAAGPVTATLDNVKVYPSNDTVVIGAYITADVPGSWLDVKGDIYLLGTPIVDGEGLRVTVSDFAFARILDNQFWTIASSLLEGPIKQAVAGASSIDLQPKVSELLSSIPARLADVQKTSGVQLVLADPKLGLRSIVPTEEALVVTGFFTATAAAQLAPKGP